MKIQKIFKCFIVCIGFLLLEPICRITNFSFFIPSGIVESVNYFLFQVGYIFSIILGLMIIILSIKDMIQGED